MQKQLNTTYETLRRSSAYQLRARSGDVIHLLLLGIPAGMEQALRRRCASLAEVRIQMRSRLTDPDEQCLLGEDEFDVAIVGRDCDTQTLTELNPAQPNGRNSTALVFLGDGDSPNPNGPGEVAPEAMMLPEDSDADTILLTVLRLASLDELDSSPPDMQEWNLPAASEGILVVDAANRIVYANQPARMRTRRQLHRLVDYVSQRGWPHNDSGGRREKFSNLQSAVGATFVEWENDRYTLIRLNAPLLRVSNRSRDINGRLERVTGLPDRDLFIEICRETLASVQARGQVAALILISLDQLPAFRGALTDAAYLSLIRNYAARIREGLRSDDYIACLGQQEFGVLLHSVGSSDAVSDVARALREKLEAEAQTHDQEVKTTVSMGISLCPQDGSKMEELLRYADMALHRARSSAELYCEFYNPAISQTLRERLILERRLRRALSEESYHLHYQPLVLPRTGQLIGAEALLRLHDSDAVVTMPGTFIPVLEETGLIRDVGRWVINDACRQLREWNDLGHPDFLLSLNISPRQFADDGLPEYILATLDAHGVSPCNLLLEITESVMMGDPVRASSIIAELRAAGVNTAIDDFGTGYSSLAYIKQLPVAALKLDRSFVGQLPNDPSDVAITLSLIDMARHLGLWVIAEGVETETQSQYLGQHGVEVMQGFHFARPMPAGALTSRLTDT